MTKGLFKLQTANLGLRILSRSTAPLYLVSAILWQAVGVLAGPIHQNIRTGLLMLDDCSDWLYGPLCIA
jgi:hypothetical protein